MSRIAFALRARNERFLKYVRGAHRPRTHPPSRAGFSIDLWSGPLLGANRRDVALTPYGDLLKRRGFLPFLTAGAFSFAAPSAAAVVLIWAVATTYPSTLASHLSYSALALAFLGLSATIPTLGAAIVSGTLADRVDRRRLMQATNLVAVAASLALVATLAWRPSSPVATPGPAGFYVPLWLLMAFPLWATIMAAATMFRPAFNASLPRLVPTADLGRANGLIYGIAVAISVAGSLSATAIVTWGNVATALLVPLALFVATSVSLLWTSAEVARTVGPPMTRFSADVTEGYRYLWRNRAILQLTVSALAINFFWALSFVELGLYVKDWLGVGEAILLGAMTTGASVGSGVGTILAGRIRFEERAGRFLIALAALQGVAILGLGLSHTILISLPLMFLFGLFPGMSATVFLATIQATVPNEVLGRVLAADEVGSYGLVPVGQYAGGVLTLVAGVQVTYLVAGACTVGVAGVMAGFRQLRALGFVPKRAPPAVVAQTPVAP